MSLCIPVRGDYAMVGAATRQSYEHEVTEYSSNKDDEASSKDETEESIGTKPEGSSTVQ